MTDTQPSHVQDIAELAIESTSPSKLAPETFYAVPDGNGRLRVELTDSDPAATPAWKQDNIKVSDPESFVRYLDKHGDGPETEIRVHQSAGHVTAIIDAGSKLSPGREHHGLVFQPVVDPEWQRWVNASGKLMSQADFAEFIEDMAGTILSPDAATMLEIATSMQVNKSVAFEQAQRLSDGNVRFGWREDTEARAGSAGDLEIPAQIELGITPYLGANPYRVVGKLRWRIREKALAIGVKLERHDLISDAAFREMVKTITDWNTIGTGSEGTNDRHLVTYHA